MAKGNGKTWLGITGCLVTVGIAAITFFTTYGGMRARVEDNCSEIMELRLEYRDHIKDLDKRMINIETTVSRIDESLKALVKDD
jgi:hypothetical protein